ncbi:hypothetical protein PV728_36240 [Streptomyces europaeiscabiei]|uniref:hypothetical protein n=1 Tax=Streptomyces europaeiscabiei TaxID=146819 RepID=UPI0029B3543A|nr:hypothetical protein [Streptomyces europaeiscabiei]MDX3635615.1 hypothetical protein [Streptomyces europaeiscabiei]MDX3653846.1 hypothetical protein [Streptomyces europaeiscabiei]
MQAKHLGPARNPVSAEQAAEVPSSALAEGTPRRVVAGLLASDGSCDSRSVPTSTAPEQVLRPTASDPAFVDVAAYTDYYRLRAGVSRRADTAEGYYRYVWPAAHNPVRSAVSADMAFQQFGCNNGQPIPLDPLDGQPYVRAMLVALEGRLGIGASQEQMAPEQVFTTGARPADPALLNGLPGQEVTVPHTDANGFPIGGVRFPAEACRSAHRSRPR